jgi:hypothetical protein
MKPLACAATRRRLERFHDGELSLDDQVAVSAHLEWCDACGALLDDMRSMRESLRANAPGRLALEHDAAVVFNQTVLSRVKAEREVSFLARVRGMFDDMHLVYAGVGAALATIICGAIAGGMIRFATELRPDSLAALVHLLATPGSNEHPLGIDARVQMPRALDAAFSPEAAADREEDAVFTLAAVVTREGRIANLELLHSMASTPDGDDAKLVEGLLNAVARARFAPAQFDGSPVAVNMVWLVAHTTVRASKHPQLDIALPRETSSARKRTASIETVGSQSRA